MALNSSEEIINDIRLGKMVILMDDEDRENEGDLVIAAECVTAEHINFMAKHARGLICLTLTGHRCDQLNLPPMVQDNQCVHNTNFTMSIEAAEGVTTGISAADRAHTVRTAVARNATGAVGGAIESGCGACMSELLRLRAPIVVPKQRYR